MQIAKITVVGNVGQDIEITELPSGTVVGNYSVASTVGEKTSWFRITSFNPSDYVRERVKKGAMVYVDGEASIDKYNDEASGKTLTALRVVQRTQSLFTVPFLLPTFCRLARVFAGLTGGRSRCDPPQSQT